MVGKINELRPCPFCGSSDVHTVNMPNLRVATCSQCGSTAKEDTWNRRVTDVQLKTLMDELDVSLPDTERLDFVIKKNMPLQQSAEGIYVKDIGFFATGREAIDAAMQKEKEKAK